jgi:hypothetical protein
MGHAPVIGGHPGPDDGGRGEPVVRPVSLWANLPDIGERYETRLKDLREAMVSTPVQD